MEIKLNKEIQDHKPKLFFGMSARQCICSAAGAACSIGTYFALGEHLGTELTSWVCILAAIGPVFMGFFSYNGLTAEQFLWELLRTRLCGRERVYRSTNLYRQFMRPKGDKEID